MNHKFVLGIWISNNQIHMVVDYMDKLYMTLGSYIRRKLPPLEDKKVPTMASKGPGYTSVDEI